MKGTLGCFLSLALVVGLSVSSAAAEMAAQSLLSEGRVDVAIADLRAHLREQPNDAEAYHLLCRAHYSLQQWDKAISAAQKAAALDPDNSDYHLWLGRSYGEKAEHSSWFTAISLARKVRSEFETAVQLNSRNVAAQSDLAEFYMEAPAFLGGGKDKARAQAQRLSTMDPGAAHWVKASLAERDHDFKVAEEEYRAAIETSGNKAEYWLTLASFFRRRNRLDAMEDAINQATTAEVNQSEVWVDAAEILYRAGRNFPGAIQLLRHYLDSNNTSADAPAFQAHYLLGSILEKQGDKQAAAEEYRAALSLAHDFSVAQQALVRVSR
jgi:cytochrome c-type biogenesis protein CcmH/NrfG